MSDKHDIETSSDATKIKEVVTSSINRYKPSFSSKLSEQLDQLLPKLDAEQQTKLNSFPVAQVVDDVSDSVIDNLHKQSLAYLSPVAVSLTIMPHCVA